MKSIVNIIQSIDFFSAIPVIAASAGVIIAVFYYLYDIRYRQKVRRTNILLQMTLHIVTREFLDAYTKVLNLDCKDYNDFVRKHDPFSSCKPIHLAVRQVINYFETLGVLLEENLIEEQMVLKFFSIASRWKPLAPIVKEFSGPLKLEWFEYFYNLEKNKKRELLETAYQML
jgi:hypothetical protein